MSLSGPPRPEGMFRLPPTLLYRVSCALPFVCMLYVSDDILCAPYSVYRLCVFRFSVILLCRHIYADTLLILTSSCRQVPVHPFCFPLSLSSTSAGLWSCSLGSHFVGISSMQPRSKPCPSQVAGSHLRRQTLPAGQRPRYTGA